MPKCPTTKQLALLPSRCRTWWILCSARAPRYQNRASWRGVVWKK
uniref:Uncharacterized protein n=1 Tax=Arundo donax TaxID=35708 RepID=A0A0A9D0D7_ARUDO